MMIRIFKIRQFRISFDYSEIDYHAKTSQTILIFQGLMNILMQGNIKTNQFLRIVILNMSPSFHSPSDGKI